MAARNVSFNSNNLQTDHIFVTDIDDNSAPNRTLSLYSLGHANGSKIPYDQYSSKNITINGTIYGDSVADLDFRIDQFKSYFLGIDKNLDIDYNNSTRRYIATMESITINRPGGLSYAGFTVSLVCTAPFGRTTTTRTILDSSIGNLMLNPGFETDTSNWLANNAATISRVTTEHQVGVASLQVVTGGVTNDGVFGAFTRPMNRGGTFTFSPYIKAPLGVVVTVEIDTFDSNAVFQRTVVTTITGNAAWQRPTLTVALNDNEADVNLYIGTSTATTFYIDAVQFEQSGAATAFPATTSRSSSSYVDSVSVGGTAPWQRTKATITFSAITGGTNQAVTFGNNGTGQQISVTRTWAATDVLVVDSITRTVTVNGTAVDYSGAFPEFQTGTQAFAYSDGFTTRTFNINVVYYPEYL